MEPERFEKDPYTVQMAIYLTYTWQAFCKTTVKQNTRVQLKDEEIETLVQKYQVNKTLLASKIKGPTLLAGLLRTTRDILKGRGQHFVDIETFALKLKNASHSLTQELFDMLTAIKTSL